MAKNSKTLFGDIFGELTKTAEGCSASASSQPSVTIATVPGTQREEQTTVQGAAAGMNLQGKLAKQGNQDKKKYDYGTKRTFPIPDDLWNDALIVMQAQGKKQVEFIQGLISRAVEENRATIEAVKKMRGEL